MHLRADARPDPAARCSFDKEKNDDRIGLPRLVRKSTLPWLLSGSDTPGGQFNLRAVANHFHDMAPGTDRRGAPSAAAAAAGAAHCDDLLEIAVQHCRCEAMKRIVDAHGVNFAGGDLRKSACHLPACCHHLLPACTLPATTCTTLIKVAHLRLRRARHGPGGVLSISRAIRLGDMKSVQPDVLRPRHRPGPGLSPLRDGGDLKLPKRRYSHKCPTTSGTPALPGPRARQAGTSGAILNVVRGVEIPPAGMPAWQEYAFWRRLTQRICR